MQTLFIAIILILCIIILFEIILEILVDHIRNHYQWLITKKRDFFPEILPDAIEKFYLHGFDTTLGWVRKPNTNHSEIGKFGKTLWHTNDIGARTNPGFETGISKISCYGDSFTFSRQVNDNETWPHYLSELTKTNVLNWGVGNHGLDQTFLRIKREFQKNRTKVVIIGIVPDTISRILSTWKHWYEYGNTMGFKPRFIIDNNKLKLIKNPIDTKEKIYQYSKYTDILKTHDYFYTNKFCKELIQFPYIFSVLKNPQRNIPLIIWNCMSLLIKSKSIENNYYHRLCMQKIMRINLSWRIKLYEKEEVLSLLIKLIEEIMVFIKKEGATPIFVYLPQKDDVHFIKKKYHFYNHVIKKLKNKYNIIDLYDTFHNLDTCDKYFSDNSEYGGHYSKHGNKLIASSIYRYILKYNIL